TFPFGFLGQNSFTIVRNAGAARIKGAEQQLEWTPVSGLDITLGATELDAKLTKDFCLDVDATGQPLPAGLCPATDAAPAGTSLPGGPTFKGNVTTRYTWSLADDVTAHLQGDVAYQTSTPAEHRPVDDPPVRGHSAT